MNVPLGGRFVLGVEESGFFDQETWNGQPCRWTNGAARLTVPLHGQTPRALALTAYIPSPPGCQVRVTVNGTKLFDGQVKPESTWSCELPLAGVELGDSARIELDSSTFVPSQVNPKLKDDRVLGIRLKRVTLLSDAPAGKQ